MEYKRGRDEIWQVGLIQYAPGCFLALAVDYFQNLPEKVNPTPPQLALIKDTDYDMIPKIIIGEEIFSRVDSADLERYIDLNNFPMTAIKRRDTIRTELKGFDSIFTYIKKDSNMYLIK